MRHNDAARFAIAGAALVVLLAAIAFSKRKSAGVGGGDLPAVAAAPAAQAPAPAGAPAPAAAPGAPAAPAAGGG